MNDAAVDIFQQNGGQLRMNEALKKGISRTKLYSLRDKGIVETISRGVYRLAEMPEISDPDLVVVCSRYPNAVICLLSAISFHGITTEIPHEISIALPRKSRLHSLDYPPIEAHQFSEDSYEAGIEKHKIDGVIIQVYSLEKTLADCFKFRNKLGMGIVLEALKLYKERKQVKIDEILKYAKICRVAKIIRPYLEASL
jgi:predicted transcriptional regulator of viral defense system